MSRAGRDRARVRALRLAFGVSIVFVAPAAAAAPVAPNVELHYVVNGTVPECISAAAFEEAVRTRLAGSTFSAREAISVTTSIERDGARLRATVILREAGEDGRLTEAKQEIFAAPHECATLGAAAALTASLTIRRSRERAESRHAPPPPRTTSPSAPALPRPAPPSTPSPLSPARVQRRESDTFAVRTQLALLGGLGVLPSASIGATFGASVKIRRLSAGLDAGAWLPTDAEPTSRGGSARAWLVFSNASACVHPGQLFACGVGTLGAFHASGAGPLQSRSGASTYLALGVRVGAEIALASPFSLVVHGTAFAPLLRPTLRLGDELLWRAPVIGGELGISVRVEIL